MSTSSIGTSGKNGYIKFNNGLIIQWGLSAATYANSKVLIGNANFIQTYTSTPTITASVNDSANTLSSLSRNVKVYNINTNNFTAAIHSIQGDFASGTTIYFTWISIGI